MKQFLLSLLVLLCSVGISAAEFKVGDAKYSTLPDGTVELKEFKKASGDVVIPEKVTDPKTKTEYTVSAIGPEAFKKAPMTTITLPGSVKVLGEKAFLDCTNLTTANFQNTITDIPDECFRGCKKLTAVIDAGPMTTIGAFAFMGTGFGGILIPPTTKEIGFRAFSDCNDLKTIIIEEGDEPLKLYPGVMYGTPVRNVVIARNLYYIPVEDRLDKFRLYNNNPELGVLVIAEGVNTKDWKNALEDCNNALVIFESETPGQELAGLLSSLSPAATSNQYFFGWDHHDMESAPVSGPVSLNTVKQKAQEYLEKEKVMTKFREFMRVAIEEPEKLRFEYRNIEPEEAVKYNTEFTNGIRVLCDSVYLVKPELSKAELDNVAGFINNLLMGIGADYGIANMNLEKWARADLLNIELQTGDHKEDYERILKTIDRYFTFEQPKNDPYRQAVQLACLCAIGKWKEAAVYFPKVHRGATDNGTDPVPTEIVYIQNAINQHGYKAVAPSYKTASSGSSDDGSLIEFFTKAAINAGVEMYKQKKAEKEFRELYYDAMGMDSKGRPRKKKK